MSGDVRVGSVRLSSTGRPAVIVPLVGATTAELVEQTRSATAVFPHLLEWRIDLFDDQSPAALRRAAAELVAAAGGIPLLLTVRTTAQGGRAADQSAVEPLLGFADLVDVELLGPGGPAVLEAARAAQVPVLGSHHDLAGTGTVDQLIGTLRALAGAGADVVKLAVTAHDPGDVAALLTATWQARSGLDVPVVTMAMGPVGAVSRVAGGVFGSAATFASVGPTSAPGQLPVEQVRAVLDVLHPRVGPRVVLVGPMGAGKSAVGRELARRMRLRLRDTDADVARAAGRSIATIFATLGEDAFRELEAQAVALALTEHTGVLALGGGAVVHPSTAQALARYVDDGGRVVWLQVSADEVATRLRPDGARPLLADEPMARWQALATARRAIYEAVATHRVETDGRTAAQVAREVRRLLEEQ